MKNLIFIVILSLSSFTFAKTTDTGIDGIVIKDLVCDVFGFSPSSVGDSGVTFNLINRNPYSIKGKIHIEIHDEHGNRIENRWRNFNLAGVRGKKIKFKTLTECSRYNHTSFLLKLY